MSNAALCIQKAMRVPAALPCPTARAAGRPDSLPSPQSAAPRSARPASKKARVASLPTCVAQLPSLRRPRALYVACPVEASCKQAAATALALGPVFARPGVAVCALPRSAQPGTSSQPRSSRAGASREPGEGTDSYEGLLAELRAEKAARLEERRVAEAARQDFEEEIRIAQAALTQGSYELDIRAQPPSTLQCVFAGVQLQLGGRVEFGGSSSVCYACVFEGQPAVVKCAAINTRTMEHSDLRPEADTLRLLNDARCPAVPRLLAQGDPVNDALPFLVIAPRGEPLCMFATRAADPRALAADVARRVLLALRGAHAAGRLHGDVRPSNVVMEDGKALLVDWGIRLNLNNDAMRMGAIGTLPFASRMVSRSFDDAAALWFADASVDLESVAYLYAAVALASDMGCVPLWNYGLRARQGGPMPLDLIQGPRSADEACDARARWLEEHRTELGEGVFDYLRRVRSGETPYDASFR